MDQKYALSAPSSSSPEGWSSNESLYENAALPVRMTNLSDRSKPLRVRVFLSKPERNVVRTLKVQLTDPTDAFFLYELAITETDFHTLKKQQSLRVDFAHFPTKFIELIEMCSKEALALSDNVHQVEQDTVPRFSAVLDLDAHNGGVLSIVERNEFMDLKHLSLAFVKGNDTAVKTYLATTVAQLELKNAELQIEVRERNERVAAVEHDLDAANAEFLTLQQNSMASLQEMQMKQMTDLTSQKQQALEAERTVAQEAEKRFVAMEQQLNSKLEEMETKCQHLSDENLRLTTIEGKYTQLVVRADSMETEYARVVKELAEANSAIADAGASKYNQTQQMAALQTQVAVLTQQVADKDELLDHKTALADTTKGQARNLEHTLEQANKRTADLEAKLQECVGEIAKGNKIISHLQGELRSSKTKCKTKANVVVQQEQVVEQLRKELGANDVQINSLRATNQTQTQQLEELQAVLGRSKQQLSTSYNQLEENRKVIDWLQRELNSAKLGQLRSTNMASTRSLLTSPTKKASTVGSPLAFGSPYSTRISGVSGVSSLRSPDSRTGGGKENPREELAQPLPPQNTKTSSYFAPETMK